MRRLESFSATGLAEEERGGGEFDEDYEPEVKIEPDLSEDVEALKDKVDKAYHKKIGTPDLLEHIEADERRSSRTREKTEGLPISERKAKTEWPKEWPKPPKLERRDMLTEDGRFLDFSQAQSYPELIDMISKEDYIVNQLGQKIPAETVINLIYRLTYQDIRNYQKEDWTNITLRHNLRAAVANLIRDYKRTPEFRALMGLDLSGAKTVEEIFELIRQKKQLVDANGKLTDAQTIISYIQQGHLHALPSSLKYKIIEINKQQSLQEMQARQAQEVKPKEGWGKKFKTGLAKLKFWGRK